MLFKTSARAFFSTMLIYCSYFWLKLHITRAVLNCCTYLAPRGDMPKSAAERTGWEEALFCLLFSASTQHTGWISGLFLCYAADALFVCFLIFVLFASLFLQFSLFLATWPRSPSAHLCRKEAHLLKVWNFKRLYRTASSWQRRSFSRSPKHTNPALRRRWDTLMQFFLISLKLLRHDLCLIMCCQRKEPARSSLSVSGVCIWNAFM